MKMFQSLGVTKKFLTIGAVFLLIAIILASFVTRILGIDAGSAADWVAGLGAIAAILAVGWQTQLQFEKEDKNSRESARPFGLDLAYRAVPLNRKVTFIFSSFKADKEFGHDSDDYELVRKQLRDANGSWLGFLHFNVIGSVDIYNIDISLSGPDMKTERIQIPKAKPGVDYVWLTDSVLSKLTDTDTSRAAKSSFFPDELKPSTKVEICFTTDGHECGYIAVSKKLTTSHSQILKMPITLMKQRKMA